MAHRAAALLPEAAGDREAFIIEIEERAHLLHALAVQQGRIRARHDHRVAAPGEGVALGV